MTHLEKLLSEQNALLRQASAQRAAAPARKTFHCADWPQCYHGAFAGGVFGCSEPPNG